MSRQTYDRKRRDLAFRVWRECDRNTAAACRKLDKEHDWPLSRPTLESWIAKDAWHAKADELDQADQELEAQQRAAEALAKEDREGMAMNMLATLLPVMLKLIEEVRDDSSLGSKEKLDSLTRASAAIDRKLMFLSTFAPKLTELGVAKRLLGELARYVQQHFPHHAPALLEVLEPFGEYIVEKYAP